MDCFFKYNFGSGPEIDQHVNTGPCTEPLDGEVVQCCDVGDTCRADGICESDAIEEGGSGFYLAGCTDPEFLDPACPTFCTSQPNSDIVYDFSSGEWQCCGNNATGARDCGRPSGPIFDGPAPAGLGFVATIIGTGFEVPLATGVPAAVPSTTADEIFPGNTGFAPTTYTGFSQSNPTTTNDQGATNNEAIVAGTNLPAAVLIGVVIGSVIGGIIIFILLAYGITKIVKKRRASRGGPSADDAEPAPQTSQPAMRQRQVTEFYAPQPPRTAAATQQPSTQPAAGFYAPQPSRPAGTTQQPAPGQATEATAPQPSQPPATTQQTADSSETQPSQPAAAAQQPETQQMAESDAPQTSQPASAPQEPEAQQRTEADETSPPEPAATEQQSATESEQPAAPQTTEFHAPHRDGSGTEP